MRVIKMRPIKIILLTPFVLALVSSGFAQQAISKDTLITLERTPCLGSCPYYLLTISANGTVTFEPKYYNEKIEIVTGKAEKKQISEDQLKQLITEFEKIDYFSLKDDYGVTISYRPSEDCPEWSTDNPSAHTSITINGKTKKVSHYYGGRGKDIVEKLTNLKNRIDEIVNTKPWIEKYKHLWIPPWRRNDQTKSNNSFNRTRNQQASHRELV
jgi:Domain of unknown function (DUF6438)